MGLPSLLEQPLTGAPRIRHGCRSCSWRSRRCRDRLTVARCSLRRESLRVSATRVEPVALFSLTHSKPLALIDLGTFVPVFSNGPSIKSVQFFANFTCSPSCRRRAYAGGILCSEFPRVPYHKRHEQPCDGRSVLAIAPCEPGDEIVGEWSRDRLVRMDARFVDAVERAIARGEEHPKDSPLTCFALPSSR